MLTLGGMRAHSQVEAMLAGDRNAATPTVPVLTRFALDGHVEHDVLGVARTRYAADVSTATSGYGACQGSTVRVNGEDGAGR